MKKTICFLFLFISINVISQNYRSPFDFPLYLSGTFGELRNNHFHTGIDIKTQETIGHNLYAIEDGYVSRIKVSTWGYGKVLYVNHPDGNTSVYAHMLKFNDKIEKIVKEHQYKNKSFEIQIYPNKKDIVLKKGEIIGLSGNTGSSGGPHLHFEIRNTNTEKPLNPLNFGFNVKDNIDPIINDIIVYDNYNNNIGNLKKHKRKYSTKKTGDFYSLETKSIIEVSGNTVFGINTFDRQNGSPNNRNGVYSIKLFLDNEIIYHFQVDELDFSTNRFINAHIDYQEYTENNNRYNRCHKLPNNQLSNYLISKNNGIINFKDSSIHEVKFEVRDIKDNLSTLKFKVKSIPIKEDKIIKDEISLLKFNKSNIFISDSQDFKVHMKKNSLYQNYKVEYDVIPKTLNTLSNLHKFMNESIPVQNKFSISIKGDIPIVLKDKVYIGKRIKSGNFKFKGKTWKDNFLSANTREFGSYCIVADTVKPYISKITQKMEKNIYGGEGSISVKIYDYESGISYYEGKIDDKWVVMEYEHKNNTLTYYIGDDLKKGSHKIHITIRDKVNNQSELIEEFTY